MYLLVGTLVFNECVLFSACKGPIVRGIVMKIFIYYESDRRQLKKLRH